MMEVRRRNVGEAELHTATKPRAVELIESLDVFPKLPKECKKSTAWGGGVSIATFLLLTVLVVSELVEFSTSKLQYKYEIDKDFTGKLRINIDLMIAMACKDVGIDIVDESGSSMQSEKNIKSTPTAFVLNETDRTVFETRRQMTQMLRDRHHAIHSYIWRSTGPGIFAHGLYDETDRNLQAGLSNDSSTPDGCRFRGTFHVHKVAGNLHAVLGIPIELGGQAHIHISPLRRGRGYNYSHRIYHLSFGEPIANRINPLEGEEIITTEPTHMFQYFLKIVPTKITYGGLTVNTFQYAVAHQDRVINHAADRHGIPGIFFRYDIFPVLVHVFETNESLCQLLIRLSALIGGVFATVSLLRQALIGLPDLFASTSLGRCFNSACAVRCRRWSMWWRRLVGGQSHEDGISVNASFVAPLNPEADT